MSDLDLYFKFQCFKGLKKRGFSDSQKYKERLNYEIKVITQMGFCGYFLIVSDILKWALRNKVPIGPGRGSAAGSLASYCLEITHINPIQYGLIFERFINPGRIGSPKIEIPEAPLESFKKNMLSKINFDFSISDYLDANGLEDRSQYRDTAIFEWDTCTTLQKQYLIHLINLGNKTKENSKNSSLLYIFGISNQPPTSNVERNAGSGLCDIDLDTCEIRRKDVIEYVRNRYGANKVAHIGTYGSMKAKAAIRDVARVLGLPYSMGDRLAKMTLEPIAGKPQSLQVCYNKVKELREVREGEESNEKRILIWAEKIENRMRSFGTHASGVLIARDSVSKIIPLYPGKDKASTTQFEMNTVEECGLIKFDFLGLRALTTINRCIKLVEQRHGIKIDPLSIPVEDEETYRILQQGDVTGIFQLEASSGIRDLLVQIHPENLEDIAVLVALYRPGPLGSDMLKHYLKVRAKKAKPKFLIEELKPILGVTGGMLIYQEQILEICKELAGYTMAEADLMRRAIGKKKAKEMEAQHEKFISGCEQNGISKSDASSIWNDIEKFAEYGFNKSHAVCYGYIAYQMAWLKTHYLLEFICACLISDSNETDKIIRYISYCNTRDIKILGPSINESHYNFSIAKDNRSIRFGLGAIKNLGKPVKEIIEKRDLDGNYSSIINFADRIDLSRINKKKMDSLVLSGAFDSLGEENRASLLGAIQNILNYKEESKRYIKKHETYLKRMEVYKERQIAINRWNSLTPDMQRDERAKGKKKPGKLKFPEEVKVPDPPIIPKRDDISREEILSWEKDLLGYFISGHPLDIIKESSNYTIGLLKEQALSEKIGNRFHTRIVAIPSVMKIITTKKSKQKMAYVVLEDKTGTIQTTVLPNVFSKHSQIIDTKTPALYDVELEVIGKEEEQVVKLLVSKVTMLPSVIEFRNHPVLITSSLKTAKNAAEKIKKLYGFESRICFEMASKNGNRWEFGIFKCEAKKANIKKVMENVL